MPQTNILNEIKLIRDETEAERQRILARAQAAADAILADAKKARGDDGTSIEKILDELEQNHSDNG